MFGQRLIQSCIWHFAKSIPQNSVKSISNQCLSGTPLCYVFICAASPNQTPGAKEILQENNKLITKFSREYQSLQNTDIKFNLFCFSVCWIVLFLSIQKDNHGHSASWLYPEAFLEFSIGTTGGQSKGLNFLKLSDDRDVWRGMVANVCSRSGT